jgi:hypothetical protein
MNQLLREFLRLDIPYRTPESRGITVLITEGMAIPHLVIAPGRPGRPNHRHLELSRQL